MHKAAITTLFVLYFAVCVAQDEVPAFGRAVRAELEMKEYAAERTAAAVKLFEYQESRLVVDYGVTKTESERRVRIKIFNRNGFDQANVVIPYLSRDRSCKIKDISGYIYFIDSTGQVVTQKVERKQIFKDRSDDGFSRVAFTFPNVRPGCVIEYHYTKIEKEEVEVEPWLFQSDIPTRLSYFKVTYPRFLWVNHHLINCDSVSIATDSGSYYLSKTYMMRDIPSFKMEPFMSSVSDNVKRIEFQLKDEAHQAVNGKEQWRYYTISLLARNSFGRQFDKPFPGTEKLVDSAMHFADVAARTDFLYRAVKKTIKWDGSQSFHAGDIVESWNKKEGNSAEINLTLLNLLRKAKITCYPMLISTRENGKTDLTFASLGQFNGVDVMVVDSNALYFLDGTQKNLAFTTPPLNILNRNALVIDTSFYRWVRVEDNRPLNRHDAHIFCKLDQEGSLKGNASIGYYNLARTEKLEEKDASAKDKDYLKREADDLRIDSLQQEHLDDETLPLLNKFRFRYTVSNTGDFYFLDPFFLSTFLRNPFKDSLRQTDIDMGCNQSYSIYFKVTIPENFTIDHMPQNTLLRMADSSVMYKVICDTAAHDLLVRSTFDIRRSLFDREEYPYLRQFFDKIYKIVNDQVVLKRISPATAKH